MSGWARAIGVFAMLATVVAGGAVQAQNSERPAFVFTGIPDQDEARLVERYGRVASYLQQKLGVPVRYLPVKNYSSAVTAFSNGEVQLAWFGGFTGVQARRLVPGSQALAQGAEDAAFRTYFIANTRLGLVKAADFPRGTAGRTFTFGARSSTSGRLMPEYFIRQAFPDKTPDEVYARIGYSGEHSRTIQLVQSGVFDLGAVDYTVWDLDTKAGRVDPEKVNVIWESPPFANNQWSVRGDVDHTWGKGFSDKLRQALLGMSDPVLLAPFGRSKFVPVTNDAYAPLIAVGKTSGMLD
ncbi:putative selenate ABC transporter substrate-binding protein [Methylobacterium haplocladii]|uniref:Putative selenate ABC transporter substrate-binding protein n=1 Tax=Methylobacterium haplocladii TaxID=1176176 RepID=A0A512IL07_9HYPH|nr:putative selenate ABC transporter substrate-binding protein [Methylobacterium haplocladii]GEO98413.1 putative selenate ABC transporter substrate-binding protein [Methylobacterium haplocladii]GJD83041.1 putative ABC transporter phosphite binding protein PhnD1 [Methylobacterium haplocladii]GLS59138.1 putative selenate ABC transporter substrate-binding protein [Methylobacterium haplocladii]